MKHNAIVIEPEDNVATLLRISRLVPEELALEPLLQEAKRQLHEEADYLREAAHLQRFAMLLEDAPEFLVPGVEETLTRENILAMDLLAGEPIESLTYATQTTRDRVVGLLLGLLFRELFDFRLIQTDPNFANYRYQADHGRIQLLDFGATREYSSQQREALRTLLHACIDGDDLDIEHAAARAGYLEATDPRAYRSGIIALLRDATEPVRAEANYNFATSDLAERMRERLVDMRLHNNFWRMPPIGVLFLHRKLGGLYMLLTRLRATVAVRDLTSRLAAD